MSGANHTTTASHSPTAQECLDDAFFRCTQAKGLVNLLSRVDDHELAIRGVHDLASVLSELLDDSIDNLEALQQLIYPTP